MKLKSLLLICLLFCGTSIDARESNDVQLLSSYLNQQQLHFIQQILPAIQKANHKVALQRQRLIKIHSSWNKINYLSRRNKRWLLNLAKTYRIKSLDLKSEDFWHTLNNRVNTLPVSLMLAQAINESAWGRSRFAKQGLNFYGQWCYLPGCGLVPSHRKKGAHYEVKRFESVQASVDSYLQNINVNRAYSKLRELRQTFNVDSGLKLLPGLSRYSSRGQKYIDSIKSIITHYHLTLLDANQSHNQ